VKESGRQEVSEDETETSRCSPDDLTGSPPIDVSPTEGAPTEEEDDETLGED